MPAAVLSHRERADGHGGFLPARLREGGGQRKAQAFAGHDEEVPVGLAGGGLEVAPGAAADEEDIAGVIDEHGGGRLGLQQPLLGELLKFGRRGRHLLASQARRRQRRLGEWGREIQQPGGRNGLIAVIELVPAGAGREQLREPRRRLRAAEQEHAAGIQAVMEEREHFLL